MPSVHWKTVVTTALCVAVCSQVCRPAFGQAPAPATILTIDLENIVVYNDDTADPSKFATDPNITAAAIPRNFGTYLIVGDIVAVNGRLAKGTATSYQHTINLRPAPNPGDAIADTNRNSLTDISTFEILNVDGTQIGTTPLSTVSPRGKATPEAKVLTAPAAVRPTGPAAALTSTPIVTFPPRENARTAASLLRTITKSVTWAPA